MRPKKQKTREEKTAEEFFPLDEDDLKSTTEKVVKEFNDKDNLLRGAIEKSVPELVKEEFLRGSVEKTYKKAGGNNLESVEKTSKRKKRTKLPTRKTKGVKGFSKRSSSTKEFSAPNISLKRDGYELIITEKPQAAQKIASALGKAVKRDNNKIPYYELKKDGKEIVVACAVGHLFTLSQNISGTTIPIFDISWKPNFLVRKKDFTKRYFDTLAKLVKNAGEITIATDYDVEGEVIGMNAMRFIAGQKDANRMKFSTLTTKELNEAYENKSPSINWGQAIAGETRHYLDWFYGINLSRALMNAIKSTGQFKIMSIGRVQGPALELIVKKEREINAFKSQPYWQIFIKIDDKKNKLELIHIKDIFDKGELSKFENLKGKTAIAETTKSSQELPPNPPFNLTTLQTEAYKFYGINPSRTLQIAQTLYLAGLISYPRTSSQKLPASIGYLDILKKIAKQYNAEHLIKRKIPVEGKKSDSAHPSIYPTGNTQMLNTEEEKIYNLIVKRFLSLFCEDAIVDNKTVSAVVDNLKFVARGSAVQKRAWLEIYPSKMKDVEIPDFFGEVKVVDSRIEQKETQPPKRYSQASIITQLEKKNLGTKATRSAILETLIDRCYVQGQSLEATPLGISLITTLEKYSSIIIDEKLTREFENKMESIAESKSGFLEKEKRIIEDAKKTISLIANDFEKNEKKIGAELVQANSDLREQQKIENTLMLCPKCKKGNLAINYSRKTRRQFVACNAYPECNNIYSLPPNGIIKKTGKTCEECSWPMLMRLSKGKRPWEFCFNPECESNKKRIEEYNRKKGEEGKSE